VILQIPIKGCRDVCFSNGGQYFAAINGITLSIYNTYTCECVGNLRGHNGKVSCCSMTHSSQASARHMSCCSHMCHHACSNDQQHLSCRTAAQQSLDYSGAILKM
jgi:hypothetical protein